MADLKLGSTAGGSVLWHQGNFPLTPVSNDLYFKTYKIYSEYNKPQAVDNDFVSKALGGNYKANVYFEQGLTFNDSNGYGIKLGARTGGAPFTASFRIKGPFGFETETGTPFVIFDPDTTTGVKRLIVMGDTLARQIYDETGRVFSPGNTPSKAQVGLGNVTNQQQVELNNSTLQTMTGNLSAPNFFSRNPASDPAHVPRFDQIVLKDSVQDFGYY
ncbi:long tail fiber protein distal subunit [Escherichia phage vB_EcoM_RZ]|uniref:Long tail fiber protein n=1 Tax=Escherichia phage vB_EcoM_RZ TaxID=2893954 RepID=A0AAE9C8S8_9CAUD|nr:long tail fiber protein distal subunit [Escherichia phage vB_EcoM_RZ]QUL77482.1 hinge connector of long tail fiber distal connector [Escherichia phage UPEC07]UGL60106.1 long tail fiber protein [Escherichia phage vB_EcoM_RZ]